MHDADTVGANDDDPALGAFVDLPDGPRAALLRLATRRRFTTGQMIIRKGDPADEVMIMQSGLAAVHGNGPDGRRLILTVFGRDEVFGEMALAGVPRRTAAVVALGDTEVLVIGLHALADLRAQTLEVDRAVLGVLADTVRRLTGQLIEATLLPQATRLQLLLIRLHRHSDGGKIAVTQELLADMLGAQRTTISELLSAEVSAGRIAKGRGYVQVLDLPALRVAAAEQ